MNNKTINVKTWKNGSENSNTGSGFGIRIPKAFRDSHFNPERGDVTIVIDGQTISISNTPSFWKQCHELRSKKLGLWFIENNLHSWPSRKPHTLELIPLGGNRFELLNRN